MNQKLNEFDAVDSGLNYKTAKMSSIVDDAYDAMNYATNTLNEMIKQEKKLSETNVVDGKVAYKEVVFDFKIADICLMLYRGNREESSALSRLNLIQFAFAGETLTDKTLWLNCTITDLKVDDIRVSRKRTGISTMLVKR